MCSGKQTNAASSSPLTPADSKYLSLQIFLICFTASLHATEAGQRVFLSLLETNTHSFQQQTPAR